MNQPSCRTGSRPVARGASGVLNRRVTGRGAKLFAVLIPVHLRGLLNSPRGFVRVCTLAERRVQSIGQDANCWRKIPDFAVLLFENRPPESKYKKPQSFDWVFFYWEPGGVLLSHGNCHTTIAAAAFHF